MSIHTIKKVVELLPSVGTMVKAASLTKELSTDTREDTIVSALSMIYMEKVARSLISEEDHTRVSKAVDMYQVREIVQDHAVSLIKAARDKSMCKSIEDEVRQAEQFIEGQMGFTPNFEKVAEAAVSLYDNHKAYISSEIIKRYAGAYSIDKQAAIASCRWRAKRTGDNNFNKIASIIEATNIDNLSIEDNRSIVSAIVGLEKSANYIESDVYRDIFVKRASIDVNLIKRTVPVESIVKISTHIGDVLGKDLGDALSSSDPMSIKHIIEALPNGEKELIEGIV